MKMLMSLTLVLGNDLSMLNSTDLQEGGREGWPSNPASGEAPGRTFAQGATGKDADQG